jgi:cell division septal protein FtsQ
MVYLVALCAGWIIFRSPVFRVDKVVVQGNETAANDAVVSLVEAAAMPSGHRTLLIKPLLGYENMLAWPSSIPTSTLAWIPQLNGLSVSKDYFSHTITITVTERQPLAIWCFVPKDNGDEQCFWFDDTGTMFGRAYDTQGDAITVIHDYSQQPTGVNEPVLPDEFLANLVSIVKVIRAANLNVSAIALNDLSLQEIDVTTLNGPAVYFSLRFPANDDLQVIQGIMAQSNWSKLGYIDCRTENRVYYK